MRKILPMASLSAAIRERVTALPVFAEASQILLFYPLKDEIDLLPLMGENCDKHWFLPRVNSHDRLSFHRFHPGDNLYPSAFGVLEPSPNAALLNPKEANALTMAFVPGLVFDYRGHRLGYGKGYYDRFLENNSALLVSVGVAPEALLSEDPLPVEDWDQSVCLLASENRLLDLRRH